VGLENLAFDSGRTGSSFTPTAWAVFAGGVIVTLVVVGAVLFLVFRAFRASNGPEFSGPALMGTAQVLSVGSTGYSAKSAFESYERHFRKIGLRVQIPGREPYDVTVWHGFSAWMLGTMRPGGTVAVGVDAANPQKVRIKLDQPITQWKVQSMPPTVVFNQPTTPAQVGSFGSPPDVTVLADQIRAALQDQFNQSPGSVPVVSAADLLASGQRVRGVLKSFAASGTTPRSLGRTGRRPELLDAPYYTLEVELHFPNLAPVTGRSVQPVPPAQVPNLAIGMELTCAVDPADPSRRFVVDWGDIAH
jgi:hypothetical protein